MGTFRPRRGAGSPAQLSEARIQHIENEMRRLSKTVEPLSVVATSLAAQPVTATTITAGVTEHGLLSGLADDDHDQYLLLAGRAGGQDASGGTASGEDLTLHSTSHATKGSIFMGSTFEYREDLARLELTGTASNARLQVTAAPIAAAGFGSVSLGNAGFGGGAAPAYQGLAAGTVLAMNTLAAFAGDYMRFEKEGSFRFAVFHDGLITGLKESSSGTAEVVGLKLEASHTAGVGGIGLAPTIQFRAESSTEGTLNDLGTILIAQATSAVPGSQSSVFRVRLKQAGTDVQTIASNANGLTTILISDNTNNAVSVPVKATHLVLTGAGAANIGVGYQWEVETATADVFNVIAQMSATATTATAAATSARMDLQVTAAGTLTTVQSWATQDVRFAQAPAATANRGVVNIGSSGFDGGANAFAGDADGTCLAINEASGFAGDLIRCQVAGANRLIVSPSGFIASLSWGAATDVGLRLNMHSSQSANAFEIRDSSATNRFSVGSNGAPTVRVDDTSGSAVTTCATFAHVNSGGVGASGIGVGLLMRIETATEGTLNDVAVIQGVGTTVTAGAVTGRLDLRVPNAGTMTTYVSIDPSLVDVNTTLNSDGLQQPITTKTGNYTLTLTDHTINADATGGAITLTLPAAASAARQVYFIKKIDASANTVTIDGSGAETIDDGATAVLTLQYEAITIQSDGSEWWIY